MVALGDYLNVTCHACIGGTNVRDDQRKLESGVQIVVGTPGRVYDMINRRSFRTDHIKMFVLDEADEMLSRGFKDQIYKVKFSNLRSREGRNLTKQRFLCIAGVQDNERGHSGDFVVCYNAAGGFGSDDKVHAGPCHHFGQEGRVDP